ncbi:cyclin-dependent kinase 4 inhibitor C [Melanotaenia boesemani]|uniref:cyclin-dependent kinase 4 inhibitor C n=1 Tax=Melanotaenia boesemani TaxID=1250792 RepID=UPI001C03EE02|nr:cyclin-dependent kinase 4 inhibitor C [Melanotaenia boesemani]XP_041862422.1 cyclin-dependent kinase 4 inhibitor C [Melanotaenia boesemani]XP_041862423.1 cyclin-dependent kinase 4 inhibitor C [Melanotaenia boesemani]
MSERSLLDELCSASASGHKERVLSLLHQGADVNGVNKFGRTPLQVVKLGDSLLIEVLLEAGADPNMRDRVLNLTVTHDAAREGFVESVGLLIDHSANVNLVDDHGNLPLHLAAREGHLEVVRLLLLHTENPHATNGEGQTALQLAHDFERMKTAECIQEYLSSN